MRTPLAVTQTTLKEPGTHLQVLSSPAGVKPRFPFLLSVDFPRFVARGYKERNRSFTSPHASRAFSTGMKRLPSPYVVAQIDSGHYCTKPNRSCKSAAAHQARAVGHSSWPIFALGAPKIVGPGFAQIELRLAYIHIHPTSSRQPRARDPIPRHTRAL